MKTGRILLQYNRHSIQLLSAATSANCCRSAVNSQPYCTSAQMCATVHSDSCSKIMSTVDLHHASTSASVFLCFFLCFLWDDC